MLDNNVNKKELNPQFLALSQQQAMNVQGQPAMQAVNPELLKENIQDSYVANRVASAGEDVSPLTMAAIGLPAWFAIAQGMDVYAKKSRGNFEDTVHHKIGQFGDDAVSRFQNSRFGKSGFWASVQNAGSRFKGFLKRNLVDRFKVTRAFAYTPSKPELDMALGQYNGGIGFVVFDSKQHDEQFMKSLKHVEDLDVYGGSKADIQKYKDLISKATTAEEKALLMQQAEFECLSKYTRGTAKTGAALDAAIDAFKNGTQQARDKALQEMKAFERGYIDFAEYQRISANPQENLPRYLEVNANANRNMFARMTGTKASWWGRLKHFLFGRDVYASETANKMAAMLGNKDLTLAENKEFADVLKRTGYDKKIPKSVFGKWLTKYTNMTLEGATNRVAGGKLIAVAQALYLAEVIAQSAKAEGGMSEKAKSFAERFAEMLSFFICMPMALQLMHKIGGLQYAGMDKNAVAAYRQKLAAFNEKAMSGGFANKDEWKAAKKALKSELNAGVKNPVTKLFKKIGRIVTVGLEQIRPYDKTDIGVIKDGKKVYRKGVGQKLKDLLRHPKFGIKQMAGYPMRIALGMFILLPIFNKIAVKTSHAIFGKPKKSLLDEGKEPQQVEANPQTVQVPPQLQQPQVPLQQQTNNVQQSQTNLLNKYKNGARVNGAVRPNGDTNTYVPSPTPFRPAQQKSNEPVRNYVPSPVGAQIMNNEDLSTADAAMQRADMAEQIALKTLKMG